MPKPRRRRRFFALEGRFEVDDTGELQGIAEQSPTAANTALPGTEGDFPEYAEDAAPSEATPAAFRPNRAPRTRATPRRTFTRASLLLAFTCLLMGLLGGHRWNRSAAPPAADLKGPVSLEPVTLTAADRDDLDAAYAARTAHNFTAANRLFAALGQRHPGWGPVEVEAGRTLYYAGDTLNATSSLQKALENGWKPAEANFLLGMVSKARHAYHEAEERFALAVSIDPTQPDYYFFWGECLREQGKLLEATAKFRSALLRNQYETATGLYRAKLWLCAIEADAAADDGIGRQVDAELARAQPPMEALFAAAAREMKAGDLPAAAAHLAAASQRSDPMVFHYILGDPIFTELRLHVEFASIFQVPAATATPGNVSEAGTPSASASPAAPGR